MYLYRIAKREYADLSGEGGLYYQGRWNYKGQRIVYTSSSRSLALLEGLVHLNKVLSIEQYVILEIYVNDKCKILDLPKNFFEGIDSSIESLSKTREYGTNFLKKNKFLLLKVPSVIVPEESNYIINPNHDEIKDCNIKDITHFTFDSRLLSYMGIGDIRL